MNNVNDRRRIRRMALGLTSAMVPSLLGIPPALAQGQSDGAAVEIVVTAQKREQSLIDVPAAVSALSGETLQNLGVQNMPEVTAQVPNFRVTYERGSNSIANLTLRGVRGAALASRLNERSVAVFSAEGFLGDEKGRDGKNGV